MELPLEKFQPKHRVTGLRGGGGGGEKFFFVFPSLPRK